MQNILQGILTLIFTYAIHCIIFSSTGVDKVVGWAVSHHLMHCSDALVKDDKLVISTERLYNFLGQCSLNIPSILFSYLILWFYVTVLRMD